MAISLASLQLSTAQPGSAFASGPEQMRRVTPASRHSFRNAGFFKRIPGPSPFSEMNIIPAFSNLLDQFASLGHLAPVERAMGLMAGYGASSFGRSSRTPTSCVPPMGSAPARSCRMPPYSKFLESPMSKRPNSSPARSARPMRSTSPGHGARRKIRPPNTSRPVISSMPTKSCGYRKTG